MDIEKELLMYQDKLRLHKKLKNVVFCENNIKFNMMFTGGLSFLSVAFAEPYFVVFVPFFMYFYFKHESHDFKNESLLHIEKKEISDFIEDCVSECNCTKEIKNEFDKFINVENNKFDLELMKDKIIDDLVEFENTKLKDKEFLVSGLKKLGELGDLNKENESARILLDSIKVINKNISRENNFKSNVEKELIKSGDVVSIERQEKVSNLGITIE